MAFTYQEFLTEDTATSAHSGIAQLVLPYYGYYPDKLSHGQRRYVVSGGREEKAIEKLAAAIRYNDEYDDSVRYSTPLQSFPNAAKVLWNFGLKPAKATLRDVEAATKAVEQGRDYKSAPPKPKFKAYKVKFDSTKLDNRTALDLIKMRIGVPNWLQGKEMLVYNEHPDMVYLGTTKGKQRTLALKRRDFDALTKAGVITLK